MNPSRPALLFLLGLAPLLGGCAQINQLRSGEKAGPFYAAENFAGEATLPSDLRRVVLLPVNSGGQVGDAATPQLDAEILGALERQQRFEVVPFNRELSRRWFGREELSSAGALPANLLERIGQEYGADAVLFVDLTQYRTLRPLAVGFRAKLATVRDVHLVWSFDEVISADDPAVANRVRRDLKVADRSREPLDLSEVAFLSPVRFAAFAAGAMFETLPARVPAERPAQVAANPVPAR
jgi:hypothetical protein